MTLPRSAPDAARRERAVYLCLLHHVEELPWADCWFRAHPDSDLPRDAAAVTAEREVDWLREYYPLDMENKLAAHGLGFDDLIRLLTEQLLATKKVHVDTIRREYRNENGHLVTEERYVYEDVPYTEIRDSAARDAVRRETPRPMRAPVPRGAETPRRPRSDSAIL